MISEQTKEYMGLAIPKNTKAAYESDWNLFLDYLDENDLSLPASPEVVANYISSLETLKANTIARRVTVISKKHIENGFFDPSNDVVKQTLLGIKRKKGTYQQGKKPIGLEEIRKFQFGDDIISIRDKAILLLGFAGAFRRSEIIAIKAENVTFTDEGMTILLESSKTDKFGKGQVVAIPHSHDEYCPVQAVKDWMDISRIRTGLLFRSFTKSHTMRGGMSSHSISLIIKKYVASIGLDESEYSGHSLRRGFATSAARSGCNANLIMKQTRHHSIGMVNRYIDEGRAFDNNPLYAVYGVGVSKLSEIGWAK